MKKAAILHFSFKSWVSFRRKIFCLSLQKHQIYNATKHAIMKKIIPLFSLSLLLLSCNSYYKVLTVQNPSGTDCKQAIEQNKRYFIFHADSAVFAMQDISLTNNNTGLKYRLAELPVEHMLHLNNSKTKKFKYSTGKGEYDRSAVINETHIYASSDTATVTGLNEIDVAKLSKIDVLEKDIRKTRRKHSIAWGIGAAGAVIGIGLIIASNLAFKLE